MSIRILEIVNALNQGGVDRIIYNYVIRLSQEFKVDFVVNKSNAIGMLEEDLKKRGCRIFRVTKIRDGVFSRYHELKKIMKKGQYQIVHDNSGYKGVINLLAARNSGVPIVITHSHFAYIPQGFFATVTRIITSKMCTLLANELFACGEQAGRWMWGNKNYENGKVHIMRNAIESEKYRYSIPDRIAIRKQMQCEGDFIVGCVARLAPQKNHLFLLKVFYELCRIKPNSKLLLIGDGQEKDKIQRETEKLGLSDKIVILGTIPNVHQILSAMDVFVLTSLYEGLPVSVIEAQFNGLPVICSSAVTKEMAFIPTTAFLSLQESHETWAKSILKCSESKRFPIPENSAYDISEAVSEIERYYDKLVRIKTKE